MIPEKIYHYDYDQLIDWLRNEAGSSNPVYFHANKPDGLKLQQVPEEYAGLLFFLKDKGIESYLELGIGNGGSFALTSFFMKQSLKKAIAVDNLAYGSLINQNEVEVLNYIESSKQLNEFCNYKFIRKSTDEYFQSLKGVERFDCIFIDADHSYHGVKKDFDNSLKHIVSGGFIIFHDINSSACPGIQRIWNDVKKLYTHIEFIHSNTCGIGVIQIIHG